ncbi:MAG: hypothetical protein HWN67_21825 [Candidatus Helarchaeota archaeon]|nr:hypothetical protein [Candidatus Helarchaeota archaeon]
MATVFERLEQQMKKLIEAIEELKNLVQGNTSALENLKSDVNSGFLNFSDMVGNRLDELQETFQTKTPGSGIDTSAITSKLDDISEGVKNTAGKIKNFMDSTIDSFRKVAKSPAKKVPIAKVVTTPPKPSKKLKIIPTEIPPPSKRAPIPIKVGKTVPVEVLDLLDSLKSKIETPAVKFAEYMEWVRDEIVRIYKFHPAIYELGTFARKLKKYPQNMKIDPDIIALLFDKIDEWKQRIGGT